MEKLYGLFEQMDLKGMGRSSSKVVTRSAALRASKGSWMELHAFCFFTSGIQKEDIAKTLKLFCSVLDGPEFSAEQPLPSSLEHLRNAAFLSLFGIASLPNALFADAESSVYVTFEENWSKILNWTLYFGRLATATTSDDSPAESPDIVTQREHIFVYLNGLIRRILSHPSCKALFGRAVTYEGLLELIARVWLQKDDSDGSSTKDLPTNHPGYKAYWIEHLCNALAIPFHNKITNGRLGHVREMLLREEGGDARRVTKRLLQLIKKPPKADREQIENFYHASNIILFISVKGESTSEFEQTELLNTFLKDGMVRILMRNLFSIIDDITPPRKHKDIEESAYIALTHVSLLLLHSGVRSKTGMHWAALMLKLGLLRAFARLIMLPTYLTTHACATMKDILNYDLPMQLSHRFVIVTTMNAVEDITVEGVIKNFYSSQLRESWRIFEDLLLERTVFNAIYERDFKEDAMDECNTCGKKKSQAILFKCARCQTLYCSKICQTVSWKQRNHKRYCNMSQALWQDLGFKKVEPNFTKLMGAYELHRHSPGILHQFIERASLEDKKFLVVNLGTFPSSILIDTVDRIALPYADGSNIMDDFLERARQVEGDILPLCVRALRGGRTAIQMVLFLPRSFFEDAQGTVYGPNDKKKAPNPARRPAVNEKGERLPFILDEIDAVVMDARKNFIPLTHRDQVDPTTPKTVYEYANKRVTERSREPWTTSLHAHTYV